MRDDLPAEQNPQFAPLCNVDEVVEGRLLILGDGVGATLLTRVDGVVRAWSNDCPHMAFPIASRPGSAPLTGGRFIECQMHNAVFRPSDGVCVAGPCTGERLKEIRTELVNGMLCRIHPQDPRFGPISI